MPAELISLLIQSGPVAVVGGLMLWFGRLVVTDLLQDQKSQYEAHRLHVDQLVAEHRTEVADLIQRHEVKSDALISRYEAKSNAIVDQFRQDVAKISQDTTSALTALTAEVRALSEQVRR